MNSRQLREAMQAQARGLAYRPTQVAEDERDYSTFQVLLGRHFHRDRRADVGGRSAYVHPLGAGRGELHLRQHPTNPYLWTLWHLPTRAGRSLATDAEAVVATDKAMWMVTNTLREWLATHP